MTCARRLAGARKPAHSAGSPSRPDPRSGRRGARLFALLPALALLASALSPFAAAPASADVLVSNINQHQTRSSVNSAPENAYSQGFTTGDNSSGYVLESIDVYFVVTGGMALTAGECATVKVGLWSSKNNGAPGEKITDLTLPSSIPAGTNLVTLAAPAGTRLEANTVYHLTYYTTGSDLRKFGFNRESHNSEDAGAASGWSIADKYYLATNTNNEPTASTIWSLTGTDNSMRIRVNGSVAPPTPITALTGSTSTDGSTFGGTLTLSPAFDPDKRRFTATVANTVTHVRLTPAVDHAATEAAVYRGNDTANATVLSSASPSADIALAVGENDLRVTVTAKADGTQRTYWVTVTRQGGGGAPTVPTPPTTGDGGGGSAATVSSDASLAGLTGSASADGTDFGETLALTPDFDADTPDYAAAVTHATTHIRLTPAAGHEDATVRIGPRGGERTETASGEPGPAFALTVGENVFEIAVTAEDGETVQTWTVTVTRAPPPAPRDDNAAREHLFPLLADGDGFYVRLFLTNVSAQAQNSCSLALHGAGLDAARFEAHPALTVSDGELAIDPGASDAGVALKTAGTGELAFGYGKLSCAEPAVARLLLVRESGGVPAALANQEGARAARLHRFPLLSRLGRPGLVLANDNTQAAACALEVETADGGNVAVPARTAVFRFLDEIASMENGEETAGGAVTVTCDRPVAALGVPLTAAGVFTALDGAAPESEEDIPSRRTLPLVLHGNGFRSRLEVTNRSDAANSCTLEFHGAGVSTARFPDTAGVTKDGFSRATFELAQDDRLAMTSFGRHSYAYGYAVLDCEGPAQAQSLLTVGDGDGDEVDGMAPIPNAQFARELRFPVAPGLDGMALFLTNADEADAVCEAALTPAGGEETTADSSIEIRAESTALRFLADLFELPEDFAGGDAKLSCDRNVAAVALPATAGAAFAAVPPVAPGRE